MNTNYGNIVAVKSGIILHQVNAQGVMGSGVAGVLRARYPKVWDDYTAFVGPAYTQPNNGHHLLGKVITTRISDDLLVCSIIGQQFFGREPKRYTSYDALDDGLKYVAELGKSDIHFPLIGCGLGGGDWKIVSAIIEARLSGLNQTLWLLPDSATPAAK